MLQGLRSLQSASPRLPVRKYDFDWHFMLRELRDAGTVEAIWQKLEALLPESGLACGVMEPAIGGVSDAAQAESTAGSALLITASLGPVFTISECARLVVAGAVMADPAERC